MKKKKYPELRNDTYNKKIKGGKSCVQDNLLTYVCVKYVNRPDDEEKKIKTNFNNVLRYLYEEKKRKK